MSYDKEILCSTGFRGEVVLVPTMKAYVDRRYSSTHS
jgi:hypothetical protein